MEVQRIVVAAPHLNLNQLALREGRRRKQMTKLLRVSWLSPRIIEVITSGSQPKAVSRGRLLETELPVDWPEQEQMLGFIA
jgi:site-specific DNA recombinase